MWSNYNGADGKAYWYNPDTGQFIDPTRVSNYRGGDGQDYWFDSSSGAFILQKDAPQGGAATPPPRTVAPGTPTTLPGAPDAAPPPPQYQHQGPTSGFSFGNLNGDQVAGYDNPQYRELGWQKMTDYLNPNNSSANYGRWLSSQLGDQYQRFSYGQADNSANPNYDQKKNDWISYLEKIAPGMRDMFLGLSSSQTGNNYGNYESGNWLG